MQKQEHFVELDLFLSLRKEASLSLTFDANTIQLMTSEIYSHSSKLHKGCKM